MFGLFRSQPFADKQFGELVRSHGYWRGLITVGESKSVPLALSGTRSEPDMQALQIAREVTAQYESWHPIIECALFEHLSPYAEAIAAGDPPKPSELMPELETPSQVWPYVSLVFVSVTPLDGLLTTELGYTTAWDEEHTLGARFQTGKFLELCGSVLPP